jgi:hypothetical protein
MSRVYFSKVAKTIVTSNSAIVGYPIEVETIFGPVAVEVSPTIGSNLLSGSNMLTSRLDGPAKGATGSVARRKRTKFGDIARKVSTTLQPRTEEVAIVNSMEQGGSNLTHDVPKQKLLKFFVHNKNQIPCLFEQFLPSKLYISGWVSPFAANLDSSKDVHCVNFGPMKEWWIVGFEEESPTIALKINLCKYHCGNPASSYRPIFNLLLKKTILCIQVYKNLSELDEGNP